MQIGKHQHQNFVLQGNKIQKQFITQEILIY